MRFFVGLYHLHVARHFAASFISVRTLEDRRSAFEVGDWIMDSGAFTTIARHGGYPRPVADYAAQVRRWRGNGRMLAAVAQDWMCEPAMLARTGLTVAEHQRLTVERYDGLLAEDTGAYIMPVLQGYEPDDYVEHVRRYGGRLGHGDWVGVGSVCKRNANPLEIWRVLDAIKRERPDLRLHGFGLKKTSLGERAIVDMLHSADSMAWSYGARMAGRDQHDWREAARFIEDIGGAVGDAMRQGQLFFTEGAWKTSTG